MKHRYDILFVTTMPSFYKVNLFNEIAKERNILVVYTGSTEGIRSTDFCSAKAEYDSFTLNHNIFFSTLQIIYLSINNSFTKVIVSGWDNIVSFLVVMLHSKSRNGCIVESSILESSILGLKAKFKRFLLKRVSTVYASGTLQRKLAESLGFKGQIIEFGGCGLLNYMPQPPYQARKEVKKFLFVGRLAEVKNLHFLISVFNDMQNLDLTIIGDGPLRESLEQGAKQNIHFLGAVNNSDLPSYYREADVFILPSKSETWGLVVEEALNNGTPVIVSSAVGCADSIVVPYASGLVFKTMDKKSLKYTIEEICKVEFYNSKRKNVACMDFIERGRNQVKAFLN